MNSQGHQRCVTLTVYRVHAICPRMFVFFVLAQTLCFAEESVDLGKIRRESPGFRQIPGFFPFLDGFQAEAASIEVGRRHVE